MVYIVHGVADSDTTERLSLSLFFLSYAYMNDLICKKYVLVFSP